MSIFQRWAAWLRAKLAVLVATVRDLLDISDGRNVDTPVVQLAVEAIWGQKVQADPLLLLPDKVTLLLRDEDLLLWSPRNAFLKRAVGERLERMADSAGKRRSRLQVLLPGDNLDVSLLASPDGRNRAQASFGADPNVEYRAPVTEVAVVPEFNNRPVAAPHASASPAPTPETFMVLDIAGTEMSCLAAAGMRVGRAFDCDLVIPGSHPSLADDGVKLLGRISREAVLVQGVGDAQQGVRIQVRNGAGALLDDGQSRRVIGKDASVLLRQGHRLILSEEPMVAVTTRRT